MSNFVNPTEILERTFELYNDYLAITDVASVAQIVDDGPEFYAPPPSAQGLIVR